jgi:hypothetical protein
MKKMINTATIEGRVYKHELALKQVQNQQSANFGKSYISGKIFVATDEDGINIVEVSYRYVSPTTNAGGANSTYSALEKVINGATWTKDGKDAAVKVKLTPSIALNDFYIKEGSEDRFVSAKRFEGGFVNIVDKLTDGDRNKFTVDMFITNVVRVDENEERHIPEHVSVKGAIFNYKNDILPVDFVVTNANGMTYFENLDATPAEPVFTKVWGSLVSEVKVETITEESAFGEPSVREVERNTKRWVLTGAATEAYEFGNDKILTVADIQQASQNRQVYLAEVKKNFEEYQMQKAAGGNTQASAFAGALGNVAPAAATAAVPNYGF